MDGTMYMHHLRTSRLMNWLKELPPSIRIENVRSSFSFHGNAEFLSSNIRCSTSGDPLGALGDLGIYDGAIAVSV